MTSPDSSASSGLEQLSLALQQPAVVGLIVSALAILVTTRLLSGDASSSQNGAWKPPTPPYWLPYFGHAPQLLMSYSTYLFQLCRVHSEGVFTLSVFGKNHTFVGNRSLARRLLAGKSPVAEQSWFSLFLLKNVFGLPSKDVAALDKILKDKSFKAEHFSVEDATDVMLKHIKTNIVDLVTFNSNPADQMDWERVADADVVTTEDDQRFMEVDLMELSRTFVARTANAAIFGTDFVENFPEFWQLLWMFDKGVFWLATKFPSWIPLSKVQRAKAARRRLISQAYEFHAALDKFVAGDDSDPRWQDFENVSPLVLKRAALFREHGVSLEGRAAHDVALAWDLNAMTDTLVFWLLYELCRDPVLLEQVREEIAPFIDAVQPENEFHLAVWVPPRIEKLDIQGLLNRCRLFQSALAETVRRYSAGWSTRRLDQELVVEGDGPEGKTRLKKGYVHVPAELYNLDPERFAEPLEWKAGRHTDSGSMEDSFSTGDGVVIERDDAFITREITLFVAILISLYDIRPPKDGRWTNASVVSSIPARTPGQPVKVWIKRRNLRVEKS
ncbi:cytochrome P450 [Stachybotrys elegans]|uniref:Cytochrome P450 n=1 Tax=Stachybotrys elegans TaxID=80388 RepID=A0A8K0SUE5_9HYPO|nr:cytochrome P450 [Stachybotrys elegans]